MEQNDPTLWDIYVPKSTFGYNATRQSSTQYSPFFLTYGREARLPCENQEVGRLTPINEEPDLITPEAHSPNAPANDPVEKRLNDAEEAKAKVITNMTRAQQKQCRDYQRRRPMDKEALIPTGSMVLVKGQKTKGKLTCTNV
jgi:hypothetical protein